MIFYMAIMLQIINSSPVEVYSEFLDQFKWRKRVLLVAASDWKSEPFLQTRRLLDARKAAVEERDILVLSVVGSDRDNFPALLEGESGFQLLLLGKDGTVKLESQEVVSIESIFELIDSMPMRQREMQQQSTVP